MAGIVGLPLVAAKPREAQRGAQLPRPGSVMSRRFEHLWEQIFRDDRGILRSAKRDELPFAS